MDQSAASSDSAHPARLGPYVVERQIGSGGMGTVYLAKDERSNEWAAVKVLPPSMSREEGLVARFQREIEALQKLKNPHVVELYDHGVDDGLYYYAMEFVDGETLGERIQETGRIPWREAIDIAVQVCSALKAAHDAGVIHRDLKPSNLMLRSDGTVKLTDFGVAQLFAGSRLTKTGGVIGTVEYMSPEQAKGGRVTKQSDLYSLGAVMYVMLTGRPPFTGKTAVDVIQKHQFGRFDRPVLYAPDMPHWLDDLVCQLLEKEPDKRPPNAYVLSRRLQEIVKKVNLSQSDDTIATGDKGKSGLDATVAIHTQSDHAVDRGPGIGTLMRDVVREELIASAQPGIIGRFFNNIWVLLILLALLIVGGVWWFQSRQLTPEQKFEAGVALMQEPEGDDWLTAETEYFRPLLEEDRERWEKDVAPHLRRIDVFKLKRRVTSGGRRLIREKFHADSEAERIIYSAAMLKDAGQFAEAERKLVALEQLLGDSEQQQALRGLVQQLLGEIRDERLQQRSQSKLISNAFAAAEQHLKNKAPDKARPYWQAIVDLYGRDPSAKTEVDRARQLLKDHPAPSKTAKEKRP